MMLILVYFLKKKQLSITFNMIILKIICRVYFHVLPKALYPCPEKSVDIKFGVEMCTLADLHLKVWVFFKWKIKSSWLYLHKPQRKWILLIWTKVELGKLKFQPPSSLCSLIITNQAYQEYFVWWSKSGKGGKRRAGHFPRGWGKDVP